MSSSDIMMNCTDLKVGYGGKVVLSGINFGLSRASLTVLIGANGSGKSTLLRTLAGNQKALGGVVTIGGINIEDYSKTDLARVRAIVSTSKDGGGGLSVEETVAVGRHSFTGWTGLLSKEDRKIVDRALEAVGMSDFKKRYLGSLSDGERQKVMIARALAQDTQLIILDEPTAFLDVAARIETARLLQNLASEGRTIILSTHDIASSVATADYIIAVDAKAHTTSFGKKSEIIESGVLDKVFPDAGLHFDAAVCDFR